MAEARQFIGLQSGAGSGKKKFPGSLGTELGHVALLKDGIRKYPGHINNTVITVASTFRITRLWKGVEKKEGADRLCSGCAGDYEDPDWTAWEQEEEEEG